MLDACRIGHIASEGEAADLFRRFGCRRGMDIEDRDLDPGRR
jgi:hypothetical protein